MQVIQTASELRAALSEKSAIAFVPTMGNLHEGHLKLIEEALKKTKHVVVSIFINPLQFNSKEDFKNYPRTLDEDLLMLQKLNVPFIFVPSKEDILDPLQTIEIHIIYMIHILLKDSAACLFCRSQKLFLRIMKKVASV